MVSSQPKKAPLSDSIVIALAQLVDDSQVETREPSHSDLEFQIQRAGLTVADPKNQGRTVGKAKRVRAVLSWAIENNTASGENFICYLLSLIKGVGGFRPTSPNFVGKEAITNAISAFSSEGYELSLDGELRPKVLDNLSEKEIEEALKAYVRRAKKGVEDAALLTGTGKDLLEAVAAHVLVKKWGTYPTTVNFPTLLGQAFTALGLSTTEISSSSPEPALKKMERALYQLGCAINTLRNKEGSGHGRPFLASISDNEAKTAIEAMGVISEYILNKLEKSI